MPIDKPRMRDAIEKAYESAVDRNFGTLIERLVDAKMPGSGVKNEAQAQAMFSAIMGTTNRAHELALAAIEALGE